MRPMISDRKSLFGAARLFMLCLASLVPGAHSAAQQPAAVSAPGAPLLYEISVYFMKDGLPVPEPMLIPVNIPVEEKIKIAVERLAAGSAGNERVLPEPAKIKRVFVGGAADAYIDFNAALTEFFPSAPVQEIASAASLCKTVMGNFGMESVQLLVEGKEVKTLGGHLDIERPITRAGCERLATWRLVR